MNKESDEQKVLVQWLRVRKITHFAPINENIHSGIIRQFIRPTGLAAKIISMIENKLKAMGKRKGVSDLVILLPKGKTVFIEMKRKNGGKESEDQSTFRDEVIALGHDAYVCHGFEEARDVVMAYLH